MFWEGGIRYGNSFTRRLSETSLAQSARNTRAPYLSLSFPLPVPSLLRYGDTRRSRAVSARYFVIVQGRMLKPKTSSGDRL